MNSNQMQKICNVSFIIIAHNEEFAINKCLESITRMSLENCEIIFVDSGSVDNTLKVAKSFIGKILQYRIIKITGHQNAAIARNAGIEWAKKKYVFFIDGDVEIKDKFIVSSISCLEQNHADATFGILNEFQYDVEYKKITNKIENRVSIKEEERRYLCGGILFTKKTIIDEIGLYREELTKGQDYDYSLRISKAHTLKALPVVMGIHHTIHYSNKKRLIAELKNNLPVFPGIVIRKNIVNLSGCISYINRAGYGKSFSIYLLLIFSIKYNWLLWVAALIVFIDVYLGLRKNQNIKYRVLSHYIFPIYTIYGFLFGAGDKKNKSNEKCTIYSDE